MVKRDGPDYERVATVLVRIALRLVGKQDDVTLEEVGLKSQIGGVGGGT